MHVVTTVIHVQVPHESVVAVCGDMRLVRMAAMCGSRQPIRFVSSCNWSWARSKRPRAIVSLTTTGTRLTER